MVCPAGISSRVCISVRFLVRALVFQQLVVPGYGNQNFFEVLKDTEVTSGQEAMTLNEDIFKCNIDKACQFVVKDSSWYSLSNDATKIKNAFVGEAVWKKMAGL